jgi:RimJ/RimL family protein N-acetyltransferase
VSAVVVGDTGELAGWAGLSVPTFLPEVLPAIEVGWRLGVQFRGRGYATEAGSEWVRYGFGPTRPATSGVGRPESLVTTCR